ncbi:MAG: ABC transporter ATP-binding protein [Clostridiales Family XIII bacterium]|jgi:ABC-type multidrug transport system ATPase subunit|nr:ABC transporter ATP-binding protein [Clostridiales Family XIII bacterium]
MTATDQKILCASGIVKKRKNPLFNPVTFSLHEGEGLGIQGPNGSGKTTLLDLFAGILSPDEGSFSRSGNLGYVMQTDGFQEQLSCIDNLIFEASMLGFSGKEAKSRAKRASELCGVESFSTKKLSLCSAGMRTRVGFAAAFLQKPALLLLDEAFGALDKQTRLAFHELLQYEKRKGLAIVFISHDPNDFEGLCERVLTLPESEVNTR